MEVFEYIKEHIPESSFYKMGLSIPEHIILVIVTIFASMVILGISLWLLGKYKFDRKFVILSTIMCLGNYFLIKGFITIPINLIVSALFTAVLVKNYTGYNIWLCSLSSITALCSTLITSIPIIDPLIMKIGSSLKLEIYYIMILAQIFEPLGGLIVLFSAYQFKPVKDFIYSLKNIDSDNEHDRLMSKFITELLALVFVQLLLSLMILAFNGLGWVKEQDAFLIIVFIEFVLSGLALILLYQLLFVFRQIKQQALKEQRLMKELNASEELTRTLRAQKHDFNNQLQVILGLVDTGKTAMIKKVVLDYSGVQPDEQHTSEMHCAIFMATVSSFIETAGASGIRVNLDITSDFRDIGATPAVVSRITMNLLKNSLEAVAKNHSGSDRWIKVTVYEKGDRWVVSVANNGPAIKNADLSKIYEAGFSTNEGSHRGYGLSIVKQLVEESGGSIDVVSRESEPTVFTVALPVSKYKGQISA